MVSTFYPPFLTVQQLFEGEAFEVIDDREEEVAAKEHVFQLGQKFQKLKDEKKQLIGEKLALTHQLEEIKLLHQEEWRAIKKKAKWVMVSFQDKIRTIIEALEIFKIEHASDSMASVGSLAFCKACGGYKSTMQYLPLLKSWLAMVDVQWANKMVDVRPSYKITLRQQESALSSPLLSRLSSTGHGNAAASHTQSILFKVMSLENEVAQMKIKACFLRSSIESLNKYHLDALKAYRWAFYVRVLDPSLEFGYSLMEKASAEIESLSALAMKEKTLEEKEEYSGYRDGAGFVKAQVVRVSKEIELLAQELQGTSDSTREESRARLQKS